MKGKLLYRSQHKARIVYLLLVWIAFTSCRGNTQSRNVSPALNESEVDTAAFLSGGHAINLLKFDDNGLIKINQTDISLNLVEIESGYNLYVKKLDKILFSKKELQGVSKVLFNDGRLLFTFYTFFSEDGANEGQAVIMNINDGAVKIYEEVLHNTCNPAIIGEKLYLIDKLQVIELDLTFGTKRILPITYSSPSSLDNPYSYLDTYLICGLSVSDDKNLLAIEFTPVKSDNVCEFYSGSIDDNNQILELRPPGRDSKIEL